MAVDVERRRAQGREAQRRYRLKHPGNVAQKLFAAMHPDLMRERSRLYMAEKRKQDPDKQRAYMRRWLYGLSPQDFERMVINQGNACGVCAEQMTKPQVDHDHDTGDVRGLLCARCNVGLGALGDTAESLERAVTYLRNSATSIKAVSA